MLSIEQVSKYKDISNEIIEQINIKLNQYVIYDRELDTFDDINGDYPEEAGCNKDIIKPFHLLKYEDMLQLLETNHKSLNFKFENNSPENYVYIMLCIKTETTHQYLSLADNEKKIVFNHLYENGINIKKINSGHYTMIGIEKSRINQTNNLALEIKYDSKYKDISNEIIKAINSKIDKYLIFNDKLDTTSIIQQYNIDSVLDDKNIKPFHIFKYQDMQEFLTAKKSSFIIKDNNVNNYEDYYYTLLCINDVMKNYEKLNKIEIEFAKKYFDKRGLFVCRIENEGNYTIIGIKKEKIDSIELL